MKQNWKYACQAPITRRIHENTVSSNRPVPFKVLVLQLSSISTEKAIWSMGTYNTSQQMCTMFALCRGLVLADFPNYTSEYTHPGIIIRSPTMAVKQPWRLWVNTSHESTNNRISPNQIQNATNRVHSSWSLPCKNYSHLWLMVLRAFCLILFSSTSNKEKQQTYRKNGSPSCTWNRFPPHYLCTRVKNEIIRLCMYLNRNHTLQLINNYGKESRLRLCLIKVHSVLAVNWKRRILERNHLFFNRNGPPHTNWLFVIDINHHKDKKLQILKESGNVITILHLCTMHIYNHAQ